MLDAKRGRRATAGQEVRFLNIPSDAGVGYGVFDTVHGFTNAQALVDYLKSACRRNYGHPQRAFLQRLVAENWQQTARTFIDRFIQEFVPANADGQVRRAAHRFALIGVAGELAEQWGIVPWGKGQARIAARVLFNSWLKDRGSVEPAEITQGIEAVRLYLELHGASRFVSETDDRSAVPNRVGFVRKEKGKPVYYVYPEAWRREILRGFDVKLITRAMLERGYLKRGPDVSHRSPKIRRKAGNGVSTWCYQPSSRMGDDPIPPAENPKNPTANS
jgi:uncharacterized protein (DUF927 family)